MGKTAFLLLKVELDDLASKNLGSKDYALLKSSELILEVIEHLSETQPESLEGLPHLLKQVVNNISSIKELN